MPDRSTPETPAWPASAVERIKRSAIKPSPHNSRRHPEAQVEQIADSIVAFGWTMPLLVDEQNILIAGEGRWLAAGLLFERGDLESDLLPVLRATGWTDAQKRAYIIADNQLTIRGEWDLAQLGRELAELGELGVDLDLTGFSGDELAEIIGGGGEGGGDSGAEAARQTLAERFGFVPFTVLSAREGKWQARKAAWIALGIESELGRGAPPGGSRQPAVDPETGKIVRADSKGRPIKGARTDAEADKAIVRGKGWGDGGPARRDPAFYAKKRAWEAEHGQKIGTTEFREKHWNPDETATKTKRGGHGRGPARSYRQDLMKGEGKVKPGRRK